VGAPLPPCALVRSGPRRLDGLRARGASELDYPSELVDARRELLETGFEPFKGSVRLVHDSSLGAHMRARIRVGRRERCGKAAAHRNPDGLRVVASVDVNKSPQPRRDVWELPPQGLPLPTLRFRRRAWRAFQRTLDPLAPPKRLPPRPRLWRRGRA
jgi:hypothetical protein